MNVAIGRVFALLSLLTGIAGCGSDRPLGPDGNDPAFAVAAVPPNVNATAASHTQIDLTWGDVVREDGFEVERALGRTGAFVVVARPGPNVTGFGDAGLTPATEYCYQVRSFRTVGKKVVYSDFSNTVCATTQDAPVLAAPSEFDARPTANQLTTVSMTWKDNSGDEEGFRVERSASDQGPWEQVIVRPAGGTSHTDFNRPLEQRLCYRVTALRAQLQSPSNVDCTYLPTAPSGLVITATSAQAVDLAWTDNSAVEEGFDIERLEQGLGVFTSVGTAGADVTTFRDASVSPDKTYSYRVRVMREGVRTGSSNQVQAVTASTAPVAPSALSATPSGSTGIVAYWTDNSGNEIGFRLERSENGGAWVEAGTTTGTGFFDGERASDQQVCYRVLAVNSVGDSPASNVDCTAPPAAPTNLVATTAPGLAIDLTWTDNSSVEDGYVVQRLFNPCQYQYYCYPYYETIATLDPNVTGYRDAALAPGQVYTYIVFATKDQGNSDWSNEYSAWSDFPPAAPSNLTAAAISSTRIDLAWSDNSDEEMFLVSRCTGSAEACFPSNFVGVTWVGADVTTFSDTSVQPNTTYTYHIVGYRNPHYSEPSNEASTTTLP